MSGTTINSNKAAAAIDEDVSQLEKKLLSKTNRRNQIQVERINKEEERKRAVAQEEKQLQVALAAALKLANKKKDFEKDFLDTVEGLFRKFDHVGGERPAFVYKHLYNPATAAVNIKYDEYVQYVAKNKTATLSLITTDHLISWLAKWGTVGKLDELVEFIVDGLVSYLAEIKTGKRENEIRNPPGNINSYMVQRLQRQAQPSSPAPSEHADESSAVADADESPASAVADESSPDSTDESSAVADKSSAVADESPASAVADESSAVADESSAVAKEAAEMDNESAEEVESVCHLFQGRHSGNSSSNNSSFTRSLSGGYGLGCGGGGGVGKTTFSGASRTMSHNDVLSYSSSSSPHHQFLYHHYRSTMSSSTSPQQSPPHHHRYATSPPPHHHHHHHQQQQQHYGPCRQLQPPPPPPLAMMMQQQHHHHNNNNLHHHKRPQPQQQMMMCKDELLNVVNRIQFHTALGKEMSEKVRKSISAENVEHDIDILQKMFRNGYDAVVNMDSLESFAACDVARGFLGYPAMVPANPSDGFKDAEKEMHLFVRRPSPAKTSVFLSLVKWFHSAGVVVGANIVPLQHQHGFL